MKHITLFSIAMLFIAGVAAENNIVLEYSGNRNALFCNQKAVSFADCAAEQLQRYPEMTATDMAKLAYQGAFGAGHALLDREKAWRYFAKEFAAVTAVDGPLFEIISPDYCRINLAAWKFHALPQTWLFNMFCASAEVFPDSGKIFTGYIREIIKIMPQFAEELKDFAVAPPEHPVHHSVLYRKKYHPSYRIVSTRFLQLLPVLKVLAKVPENSPYIIAIDGRAASGKTTFSRQLGLTVETDVIHMDDFFLPVELRSSKRLAEPGGNVHYERFKAEVLPRLRRNAAFAYQRFDCSQMRLGEMRQISASNWRIVEGAYSMHPEFGNYADLKIFFDITPSEQLKRIRKRNGEHKAEIFASRWIPLEEKYISTFNIKQRADLILGIRH